MSGRHSRYNVYYMIVMTVEGDERGGATRGWTRVELYVTAHQTSWSTGTTTSRTAQRIIPLIVNPCTMDNPSH